ncbi:MAG TPA: peptide chain release factor N(5)-glutamine methyltransferase [Solirubrobacteraceae bacterium]
MAETVLARRGPVGLALATARDLLADAGCETPRLDAELLLAEVLGVGRERLVIDRDEPLSASDWVRFDTLVARRRAREPVAYILGRRDFRHLTLSVDRRVLIPRPETELLVEIALGLPAGARVLDVGTGSGAVALALADERPDLAVRGVDLDDGALAVAEANAAALGLAVSFAVADLLDGEPADAILANLPYVPDGVAVAPEIARYEPAGALFAGVDGLDVIRRLVTLVGRLGVARPALLALELSPEQAAEVAALVADAGYATVQRLCDLAGSERVVAGRA